MVNDQEPRYRLVDEDGDIVGSFYAESDGTLKLQEGTSGNDNELALDTQGALNVEQANVGSNVGGSVTEVISFGLFDIKSANDLTLSAGSTETLLQNHGADGVSRAVIEARLGNFAAAVDITGTTTEVTGPGWSNTSGGDDYNIFSSSGDILLENNTGSSEDFAFVILTNK